jgi:hypothetical protein
MKTKVLMLLIAAWYGRSYSQPHTGMTLYDHQGIAPVLTAGTYVTTNPGFLMAGWNPLVVDKVDVDGLFNGSPGEFSKQYSISSGGSNCSPVLSPQGASGVSIIETFQGSTQYAMATALTNGCVVAFMDNTGNVTSSNLYLFPLSPSFSIKPVIIESKISPGNYYVMGTYFDNASNRDYMYVIYTNMSFTSGWSCIYDIGAGTIFNPRSMVESTYGVASGELLIAGMLNLNLNGHDGFVLTLDKATMGSINSFYRYYANGNGWDWFHCIKLAASNNGYVVGGWTDINAAANGYGWMARLNTTGSINWSSQIKYSTNANAGSICDVIERVNSLSGYEYYGLTQPPSAGMLICKLNNNGTPVTGSNLSEFWYNPSLATDIPISFSYENTPGNINEGLHSFGLTLSGNDEFCLVQSCFNGAAGNTSNTRQVLQNLTSVSNGPSNFASVSANITGGLMPCPNFQIISTPVVVTANHIGGYLNNGTWPSSPYGGSNARSGAAVGLADKTGELSDNLAVYPNPATRTCFIRCNFREGTEYHVKVQNVIGEVVREYATVASGGLRELEVNIEGLSSGVYLIRVDSENERKECKLLLQAD